MEVPLITISPTASFHQNGRIKRGRSSLPPRAAQGEVARGSSKVRTGYGVVDPGSLDRHARATTLAAYLT